MQEETQPNYTCPPDRIPNKDSHSSRPVNGGGPPARLGENAIDAISVSSMVLLVKLSLTP